jgi:hypothetical protein
VFCKLGFVESQCNIGSGETVVIRRLLVSSPSQVFLAYGEEARELPQELK